MANRQTGSQVVLSLRKCQQINLAHSEGLLTNIMESHSTMLNRRAHLDASYRKLSRHV
jgi:hypothetical protein